MAAVLSAGLFLPDGSNWGEGHSWPCTHDLALLPVPFRWKVAVTFWSLSQCCPAVFYMWHSLKSHRLAWHLLAFVVCAYIFGDHCSRAACFLRSFNRDKDAQHGMNARNHAHSDPA